MKKNLLFLIIILFFFNYAHTEELKEEDVLIIDLHKIDQGILENLGSQENESSEIISELSEVSSKDDNLDSNNENILEISEQSNQLNSQEDEQEEIITTDYEISLVPDFWQNIQKDELIFLFQNINNIYSTKLRNELLSKLNFDSLPPMNLKKIEFEYLVITNLIKFGNRDKAYKLIKSLVDLDNKTSEYKIFYNKFELDYLLSSYDLSGACEFRNQLDDQLDDQQFKIEKNYLLKIDIFCSFLQEKFQEADLLNTILLESQTFQDDYFQYLFEKLNNSNINSFNEKLDSIILDEKTIFLYSAMHRVGDLPLNNKFLNLDPINLSMPIILSSTTDIDLRLKAAHEAYKNGILSLDSLEALYQTVDFSFKELNDPNNMYNYLENNIEIGMAYYFQHSKIQLFEDSRLKSVYNFWKFAEKNNLKIIAYKLSKKILDSIEPSSELSEYGPEIAKAYIYNNNFDLAKKWIKFSQNILIEEDDITKLKVSQFLFNLLNLDDPSEFSNILIENLQNFEDLIFLQENNQSIHEILYTIYEIFSDLENNPFKLSNRIIDNRIMPSIYLVNKIRKNSVDSKKIDSDLLLSIIVSLDGKKWDQIHPEHMRLILEGLQAYENGYILNEIILEILEQSKII